MPRPEPSVTMLEPVSVVPGAARRHGARGRAWVQERFTDTPGRLELICLLLILGAICFGAALAVAERSRGRAATAVKVQTEPLLVEAVSLYTALSDANATATTTFRRGRAEPPRLRDQYLGDLRAASTSLASLTRRLGGSGPTSAAVTTIARELPVYSGLVEAARANNRQGLPVGAAYLRHASALLAGTILPAASHAYAAEAHVLTDDFGRGMSTTALVVLVAAIVAALVLLIVAQRYVSGISRRVFNVPMVLATVVIAALAVWTMVGVISEQAALASARRDSDAVELLSASRILLSRAQSDESLVLVNRGSDDTDPIDLHRMEQTLRPPSGLLAEARSFDADAGHPAAGDRLEAELGAFTASPSSASAANRLSADLQRQISGAQARFATAAADSTSSLSGLTLGIPLLTTVACALGLLGLRQRLEEYR